MESNRRERLYITISSDLRHSAGRARRRTFSRIVAEAVKLIRSQVAYTSLHFVHIYVTREAKKNLQFRKTLMFTKENNKIREKFCLIFYKKKLRRVDNILFKFLKKVKQKKNNIVLSSRCCWFNIYFIKSKIQNTITRKSISKYVSKKAINVIERILECQNSNARPSLFIHIHMHAQKWCTYTVQGMHQR